MQNISGEVIYENIEIDLLYSKIAFYRNQGFRILEASEQEQTSKRDNLPKIDIYIFAKEMLILLQAGLNINETIQTFILKENNNQIKTIYLDVQQKLNEGQKLSQAFSAHEASFPRIFISAIRSSETSGNVQQALHRFITYQHQERLLKAQIKSASIYPIILMLMGTLVTLFLLGYVVPKFSMIYNSSGRDIPMLSKLLLAFGDWVSQYYYLFVVFLIVSLLVVIKLIKSPTVQRYVVNKLILNKIFKQIFEEYYLSKFYRVLGLLLESGMSLVEAIQLSKSLLHSYYNDKISYAINSISSGIRLSEAFFINNLAPPVAYSLLTVGERTGEMSKMLDNSADFYEEKLTGHIQFLMKIIEPILMIFIGLIIGMVVILLYLPIFDLAGTVGS